MYKVSACGIGRPSEKECVLISNPNPKACWAGREDATVPSGVPQQVPAANFNWDLANNGQL